MAGISQPVSPVALPAYALSGEFFSPSPIPATSLIPLGTFPLLGVLSGSQVAAAYGHPLVLLFVGGSLLLKAMEKSSTHRQLALGTVRLIGGTSSRRIVFGFQTTKKCKSMFWAI